MTESGTIRVHRAGDAAVVVLDRPAVHNALGTHLLRQLKDAVLDSATCTGAIVLAAEGRHFCVGADLQEVTCAHGNRDQIRAFLGLFHDVVDTIAGCPVPVIAAVQGLALAGGLELSLAGDLIIAADDAQFGDQHINVDLIPGGGGSQRLPCAIGVRRALALQLLGNRIDAHQALQWGLVHSVHTADTLRDQAIQIARSIARRDRVAVSRIRELSRAASTLPLRQGLDLELATAVDHLSRPDLPIGLRRFAGRGENDNGPQDRQRPDRAV